VKFWANEITRLPGNFRTGDKILILPSDSTGPLRDLLAQKTVVSPQPIPLPTSEPPVASVTSVRCFSFSSRTQAGASPTRLLH
jgi:hypothetical protein